MNFENTKQSDFQSNFDFFFDNLVLDKNTTFENTNNKTDLKSILKDFFDNFGHFGSKI